MGRPRHDEHNEVKEVKQAETLESFKARRQDYADAVDVIMKNLPEYRRYISLVEKQITFLNTKEHISELENRIISHEWPAEDQKEREELGLLRQQKQAADQEIKELERELKEAREADLKEVKKVKRYLTLLEEQKENAAQLNTACYQLRLFDNRCASDFQELFDQREQLNQALNRIRQATLPGEEGDGREKNSSQITFLLHKNKQEIDNLTAQRKPLELVEAVLWARKERLRSEINTYVEYASLSFESLNQRQLGIGRVVQACMQKLQVARDAQRSFVEKIRKMIATRKASKKKIMELRQSLFEAIKSKCAHEAAIIKTALFDAEIISNLSAASLNDLQNRLQYLKAQEQRLPELKANIELIDFVQTVQNTLAAYEYAHPAGQDIATRRRLSGINDKLRFICFADGVSTQEKMRSIWGLFEKMLRELPEGNEHFSQTLVNILFSYPIVSELAQNAFARVSAKARHNELALIPGVQLQNDEQSEYQKQYQQLQQFEQQLPADERGGPILDNLKKKTAALLEEFKIEKSHDLKYHMQILRAANGLFSSHSTNKNKFQMELERLITHEVEGRRSLGVKCLRVVVGFIHAILASIPYLACVVGKAITFGRAERFFERGRVSISESVSSFFSAHYGKLKKAEDFAAAMQPVPAFSNEPPLPAYSVAKPYSTDWYGHLPPPSLPSSYGENLSEQPPSYLSPPPDEGAPPAYSSRESRLKFNS